LISECKEFPMVCHMQKIFILLLLNIFLSTNPRLVKASGEIKYLNLTIEDYDSRQLELKGDYTFDTSKTKKIEELLKEPWLKGGEKNVINKLSGAKIRAQFFTVIENKIKGPGGNLWKKFNLKNDSKTLMEFQLSGSDLREAFIINEQGIPEKIDFPETSRFWKFLLTNRENDFLNNSLLNNFSFSLNPRQKITLVIKYELSKQITEQQLWTIFQKKPEIVSDKFTEYGVDKLLLGAIIILLLFNILTYIILKKKEYLYFFLYIGFMLFLLIDDRTKYFLLGNLYMHFIDFDTLAIILGATFYILFMRTFLNQEVFSKGIILKHSVKILLSALVLINITEYLCGIFIENNQGAENLKTISEVAFSVLIMLSLFYTLLIFLNILFKIIRLKIKNFPNAEYALIGNLTIITALILLFVNELEPNMAFIPVNYERILFSSGFFVEGLVFSIGINQKINRLQKEKEEQQQNFINTLELKIDERTSELQREKIKIEKASEEIIKQRDEIEREKIRSEELLLNILPQEVAEELKDKGESKAKLVDEVTVLFTDFKDFTAMSEKLTPQELVNEIHDCFSAFDAIMQKHGVEKIKTIGDSYMAAGGLPIPKKTHATDAINAALEIQTFMEKRKIEKQSANEWFFEIRIGIHTGPVVAGIVGLKKFSYDIWGDTVNTASRMESAGETGKVNISGSTYEKVKTEFTFQHRGKIQAKGKGELEMYFVQRLN